MKSLNPQLVLDTEYLPAILELIEHAKTSIDIMAFSFAIGSAGGKINLRGAPYQIAEKLVEKKKRLKSKIKIRLYIESQRETSDRNAVTAKYLADAGVDVHFGSTHAKGFCFDKKVVLFGSTNLTDQSIRKNSETNVLLIDPPSVKGFLDYFEHLWKGGRHGAAKLKPPMIADGDFKDSLIDMIESAERSLEFSIYFFYHPELEKAFINAHKRGVHIRGYIHDHGAFGIGYVRRTHAAADRLRRAGIEDLFYGPRNLFTHSKYLIKDKSEILIGTGNWIAEDIQVHPQIYTRFENKVLCKNLSQHLSHLIKKAEVQIPTDEDRFYESLR